MKSIALALYEDGHRLRLHLDDPRLLFHAPDIDPIGGQYSGRSGLDLITQSLGRRSRRALRRTELEIQLVSSSFDMPVEKLSQALRAYCVVEVAKRGNRVRELRGVARRVFLVGGLSLAICLLASYTLEELRPLPDFANRVLVGSFLIAGWVSMWRPLELFLCEWRPSWREMELFETIGAMPVSVSYAQERDV